MHCEGITAVSAQDIAAGKEPERDILAAFVAREGRRLGIPTPTRYLAYVRLIRAARLFENPGLSVADVANHLDYSSPQSFGRHVKSVLAINATGVYNCLHAALPAMRA